MLEITSLLMAYAIAITLLLSGISKIYDIQGTIRSAIAVGILPTNLARGFGFLLPFAEVILAVILFITSESYLLLAALLLVFVSFVIANAKVMLEKKDLACHCFGRFITGEMGLGTLMHSLILIIYWIPVCIQPTNYTKLLHTIHDPSSIAIIFMGILCLVGTGMISRLID
ncbi:MauE/DoxX family redox-associated membrane protein [Paenibacillus bouchesdurhonensis]|uniref:MauE/DoxX family redox-associated membrane protein n=1 Tax=Paenibacillus bouchesdurhonensis TaxID=1870990 RepID=UPI000DA62752|nr:MauE/DoxX family redox-associated membrane protein [Paenibacillus bouchesdurhonensis]